MGPDRVSTWRNLDKNRWGRFPAYFYEAKLLNHLLLTTLFIKCLWCFLLKCLIIYIVHIKLYRKQFIICCMLFCYIFDLLGNNTSMPNSHTRVKKIPNVRLKRNKSIHPVTIRHMVSEFRQ